jgi:hypothetical protein
MNLLGGAQRGKTRPRGFVEWKPQATRLALLDPVQAVLTEYAAYLPLTCRQIFYRLVGAHGYDKTEAAYERLCEMLNRARLIAMEDIRDDSGDSDIGSLGYSDAEGFMDTLRWQAKTRHRSRQSNRPSRLRGRDLPSRGHSP